MPKEPISQFYYSHRLKLHFWDWGDEGMPCLILIHGGMDHARSWDRIAEAFAPDYRIIAPDLRGHGDSSWAPGAVYSFAEYLLDLATLVDIVGGRTVHLIGHSLGAAIVLQYAGLFPDRVCRVVAIEGVVPPPALALPRPAWERMRDWIEAVRACERRTPHRYPDLRAASERMHRESPYLTDEMARHLTRFGSNWNPDGTLSWKFDNFIRAIPPYSFNMGEAREIWSQIRCPVLLFHGLESFTEDPEKAGVLEAIADHRLVRVADAGHWLHHDRPALFIEETGRFFAG